MKAIIEVREQFWNLKLLESWLTILIEADKIAIRSYVGSMRFSGEEK
jgi:hypothetical protein